MRRKRFAGCVAAGALLAVSTAFAQNSHAPVRPETRTASLGVHPAPLAKEPVKETTKALLPAWTGDDGGIAGPGNDPCATPAVLVGDSGSAATDTTTATN
ncbi:MAG: hypothetical protein AB7Q17_16335, partial [Phycisphaerae bacterium]